MSSGQNFRNIYHSTPYPSRKKSSESFRRRKPRGPLLAATAADIFRQLPHHSSTQDQSDQDINNTPTVSSSYNLQFKPDQSITNSQRVIISSKSLETFKISDVNKLLINNNEISSQCQFTRFSCEVKSTAGQCILHDSFIKLFLPNLTVSMTSFQFLLILNQTEGFCVETDPKLLTEFVTMFISHILKTRKPPLLIEFKYLTRRHPKSVFVNVSNMYVITKEMAQCLQWKVVQTRDKNQVQLDSWLIHIVIFKSQNSHMIISCNCPGTKHDYNLGNKKGVMTKMTQTDEYKRLQEDQICQTSMKEVNSSSMKENRMLENVVNQMGSIQEIINAQSYQMQQLKRINRNVVRTAQMSTRLAQFDRRSRRRTIFKRELHVTRTLHSKMLTHSLNLVNVLEGQMQFLKEETGDLVKAVLNMSKCLLQRSE